MNISKKNSRKQHILTAAAKVFSKEGYHAATIADICKESRLARGTIYLYFKNKKDIFETLFYNYSDSILKNILMFDSETPLLIQFNRNIRNVAEIVVENSDLTKIIVKEAVGVDVDFDRNLMSFYTKLTEYTEGALVMMQKNDLIPRDLNARLLTFSLIGTIKEILSRQVLDNGKFLDLNQLTTYFKNFKLENFIQFK